MTPALIPTDSETSRRDLYRDIEISLETEAGRLAALIAQLHEDMEALQAPSTTVSGASVKLENHAQVSYLLEKSQKDLDEVFDALERVRDGSYGACDVCGVVIPFERLEAMPETRICVSCAAQSLARY